MSRVVVSSSISDLLRYKLANILNITIAKAKPSITKHIEFSSFSIRLYFLYGDFRDISVLESVPVYTISPKIQGVPLT